MFLLHHVLSGFGGLYCHLRSRIYGAGCKWYHEKHLPEAEGVWLSLDPSFVHSLFLLQSRRPPQRAFSSSTALQYFDDVSRFSVNWHPNEDDRDESIDKDDSISRLLGSSDYRARDKSHDQGERERKNSPNLSAT